MSMPTIAHISSLGLTRDGILSLENMCIWLISKNKKKIKYDTLPQSIQHKIELLANGDYYQSEYIEHDIKVVITQTKSTCINSCLYYFYKNEHILIKREIDEKIVKVDSPYGGYKFFHDEYSDCKKAKGIILEFDEKEIDLGNSAYRKCLKEKLDKAKAKIYDKKREISRLEKIILTLTEKKQ